MPGEGNLISQAVGVGLGTIGSLGKLFSMGRANKDLKKLYGQDPNYETSASGIANKNLTSGRLALAGTLLNARMPGAARIERNIYAAGGNQRGFIGRNSTDSSQNLALGAAELGQETNAFGQLGEQEAQDYQRRYGNYVGAQEGVINEGDKVFSDQTRRFGDKVQIQGAINENRSNAWTNLQNLGGGIASYGMNGGFSKGVGSKPPSQIINGGWG